MILSSLLGFWIGLHSIDTSTSNILSIQQLQTLVTQTQSSIVDSPPLFTSNFLDQWHELESTIRDGDKKQYTIRWEGYGGMVFFGGEFQQAIVDAQKQGKVINIDVIGPAISMHALSVCYADNVNIRPGASLVFHSIFGEDDSLWGMIKSLITGKTQKVYNFLPFELRQNSYMWAECINKGYVNRQDLDHIFMNREMMTEWKDKKGNWVKVYSKDE